MNNKLQETDVQQKKNPKKMVRISLFKNLANIFLTKEFTITFL
jgi:hypothetical protein